MKHLIFYDGTCGMCHRVVQFVIKHDTNHSFDFAPLQGITATQMSIPRTDTIVLIENYKSKGKKQTLLFGKAALRTCWLLGGLWKIPGIISFLPAFLYDWIYKLIAKHRFEWFKSEACLIPKTKETNRFLP